MPTRVFCFLVFLGLPIIWVSCFTPSPFSVFLIGNIKKTWSRKLCRIILLHFGLVTSQFHVRKSSNIRLYLLEYSIIGVSWITDRFKILFPYHQISISSFLIDIDLMFNIFKNVIPVFLEDIYPIVKMSTNFKMDLQDLSARVFSKMFKMLDFRHFEIS